MRNLQSGLSLAGMLLLAVCLASAQTPVGTISGTVFDASGALIPDTSVTITNTATGLTRQLKSDAAGVYSASALPAGAYEVRAKVEGFYTLVRQATVEAGTTTTVDLHMRVGKVTDSVTVEAATAQINYENHSVEGVITRQQIQDLPLNGRSFIQLAQLEPGVSVSPGTTSQYNALFTVSILGGDSSRTAINLDGGTIRNEIEGDTQMNLSQEVVQEFQVSTANFDLSTDITSVGSINVVTRQGGNQFHGSGYFFFRDHNMAAYPALNRNPFAPNPFFARRNPGFWISGPIKKDRLFFFFNYEYMNQTQLFTVQPDLPSVAGLAGNFGSPYKGKNLTARFDYRLTQNHTMYARYSHDGNRGFGPSGGATLPSNWLRNTNWSDQTVFDLTSSFPPSLVNDLHFGYTYWQNRNLFPGAQDCPGCLGLAFPDLTLVGSSNFEIGNTSNATQGRDLRRYTFQDSLTWQKGTHRLRWGTELEHAPGTGFWGYCDPACAVAFSPEFVASVVPAAYLPLFNLPTTISSNADLLRLPFAGAAVGLGDPSQPPPYNVKNAKVNDRYRVYFQDTWKLRPNFTINYGLAWEYESTIFNNDLSKPQYLAPLYGNDLSPTRNNPHNFSPALGFAWNVGKDNKTVIRAGAGIYYDTEQLWMRLEERSYIGPVGNGRILYPYTGFVNIFPGIINFNTGQPVNIGDPLPGNALTNLTLGQYLEIQNQESGAVEAKLVPSNSLAVRNIQIAKNAVHLYPPHYPLQRSYQTSIGVQREVARDLVITADFVRRVFTHTNIGDIDYNHFNRFINGVQTPVIPICQGAQADDPSAECSTGPITFWTPGGRGTYNALLVKANKRLSHRVQGIVSYALQSQHGLNGIYDNDNWYSSYGPQGSRQRLTVSGIAELPWGFELGLISTYAGIGPVMATIPGVDLTGSGIATIPIPGIPFNGLNRGYGKDDLAKAVAAWNAKYPPGSVDARGQAIPQLGLPPHYSLGQSFNCQDIRLTKNFTFRERYKISIFGEMFNVLNIANLGGYSFNLGSNAFGQPTNRESQVFGSGGPRAVQVGSRFTF
jgi:carboxypeptidase family protein